MVKDRHILIEPCSPSYSVPHMSQLVIFEFLSHASGDSSDEPTSMHSLATAIAAHTHKVGM